MRDKKGKRIKQNKKTKIEEEEFIPKAFQKKKKKAEKEEKKNKKEKKHKRFSIKKFIFLLILITILVVGIWLGIAAHTWKTLAKNMLVNENSAVKDTSGNVIAELGSEKKKKQIALSEMPDNLKNAYISIEDERFYSHAGVDIKRTGSAIFSYIIHFGSSSFGGSTITQQLVKNLTGDSTDSITRKINEWWKAWQLETCLSKQEILEAYLNMIYVGPNLYGVETGATYYFNKSTKDLSLEECAFLAGLNHSPNSYNPFEEKENEEKIKKRTKIVLSKMLELNYINETDYEEAIRKVDRGLQFKKGTIPSGDGVYSYHTDALITEVTNKIANQYHISQTFASNYLTTAGLTIQSTQDSNIQNKLEKEFEKKKYQLASENSSDTSQAAMVMIDQKTGNVVGCTGGLGEKTTARSLNRATQSIRQTGSAIKPIAVLAPAIDKKIITASSIFDDTKREFDKGYSPEDYSDELGEITVRRAVESSQNIPFVEIMKQLKPNNAISYLEKMGVTTLTKKDNNLALSLGGLEKGISPLEMAGTYATIANDGVYIEPTFFTTITDRANNTLLKSKQKSRRVFSKEVAYILKELLTQPVKGSHGTATYCAISGMDVAAKTGTTDDNYDRWLCGFTPYYTAVTWFGYDQNESIDYYDKNPAGLIWANVMNQVHSGLKGLTFKKPDWVKTVTVCSKTGKKSNSGCPNTYEEYFLLWTEPGICSVHSGKELPESTNTKNITIPSDTKTTNGNDSKQEEKATNTPTTNSTNQTQNSTTEYPDNHTNTQNTTNTNTSKNESTSNNTNNTNTSVNTNTNTNSSSNIENTTKENQTSEE